ncbi:hypothetical protein PR048_007499 [Dryococelus australis]|uniref:HTH psq-type domain-containing protein n=1 Tax=Dryococelus australis TaxID=614101 RepID=A0ABQ9HUE3_9NEOP|nr:hypothetical protein PR048_007499 [Dryococelus australis]
MVSQPTRRNEELNRSVETPPCEPLRGFALIRQDVLLILKLAMERKLGISWAQEDVTKAMDSVLKDKVSVRCAAITHGIPRRMLRNHLLSGSSQKM